MKRQSSAFFPLLVAMCLAVSAGAQSNGVLSEVWLNLGGTAVADLTNAAAFPSNPSSDGGLTNGFETPTDVYDDFGQRLRALLIPPVSGSYVFFIASDDNSQLYLSTNDTPAGARLIARVDGWTPARQYHNQASQKSAAISLIAGQRYYLEALMKEGGGGDNLAVAWQKPGDPEPANDSAPIPNANLLPFGLGPPVFTVQPSNTTIVEGGVATFSIQLARAFGASFQWLRNGANIPAAAAASYTLSPVRLADNGSTFYCRAANAYGVSNSSTAILTVVADTNRPTISFAQNFGDDTLVTVGFSEPLDPASASTLANYTLNNGAGILGVTLLGDATVLLRSTPLAWGTTYTLTVNNVRDLAQTPNTILPNSQRSFVLTYAPLDVSYLIGTNEPAGPSSRRTALAISEIMYRPSARADGRNLEFIEIYNSNPWAEDLGGHRLSGDVGYTFPAGTTIGALSYRVIAANPADVQAVHGLANVLGPLTNSTPGNNTNVLDNGGGMIRLRDELNAVLLEVNYDDEPPWPAAADGAGHSLVLARPSYGENDVRAWAKSDRSNGSPGAYDVPTANAWRTVLINEVLTHTDPPLEDFIELFNYSSTSVNVGNCVLTDDFTTNKFRIPAGTTIPARGFLAYTATQLGFALSSEGETVYFLNTDGTRVLDALRFGDQENSLAFGRFPDGNPRFGRLSSNTRGAPNARPRTNDVVINEIMYHPVSGDDADEFVEVHNRGSSAVNLEKWRLRGGISFTFPVGTVIPPGGYLVVANNAASLLTTHPNLSSAQVLGNYGGKLGNSGDVISLDKPDQVASTNQLGQWVTNTIHVVVDEVTYGTGGRWGRWSDGGGSSLERRDPRGDGRLASTWADSDETAKSGWTTIEFTGVLDNGAMASADQLQIFMLGPGECLVDSVEVIPQGGANRIVNGNFDSGAGGWFFQGTHEDSLWQGSGGFSGGCLRLVASDRGDPGANRIRTVLSQPLAEGSTATLRAKVKWLKGHPEILLRLHGNWLEATGNSLTTRNLGSPGAQNTQFRTNAGPAITDVQHSPVLPTAGQAVIVTAQIADPDSVSYVVLHYRVDPATNYTAAAMTNRGAGFYSVAIPGQTAGKRVAFFVEAQDGYTPVAMSRFPEDAPVRECLVGFGESVFAGSFGDYRLWLTQQNVNRWASREKQSNRALDATFVYGGFRVCYNVGTLYSGSPWHTPQYNSPAGNLCDYEVNFAKDDGLLGASDFVLGTIGNLNSDPTFQAERTAYWIGRELGTPYLHRRHIRMFFNAQLRSTLYEDCQQPDREVVSEFFPDDDDGKLHKIEDWFEFNDSGDNKLGNVDATLENFTTTGGAKKTARYRWTWRPRAVRESADFTNLFALVDAVNASQPEPFRSHVLGQVDVEEFMRVLAVERIVGNWDSYGYYRGKNMYAYKPQQGRWALLPWDIDFVMSSGGSATDDPLFGSNAPLMDRLRAFPEFQRAYWRAFQDAANGPLLPANLAAQLDPRYSALVAQGVSPASPQSLKDYAAQRRSFIMTQLATVASPFTVNSSVTVSNGLGVITGTAPVGVATLAVNGAAWTVRWTSVNSWFATVPLQNGSNFFSVVGLDLRGQPVVGASNGVSRIHTVAVPSPVGTVVINEILFTPVLTDAEFVELFNTSSTNAFDLSGWTFNGLSYTFPNGTVIGPRGFLVLVKNRAAFNALYGPGILVFDEFSGNLQSDGETLSLLKPGLQPGTETVVDRVRYEAASPWPAAAPGASLQLRDPTQDNSRVANWAQAGQSGPQWVFASSSGNATSSRIYIYLQSAGDICLDDMKIVAGSVPETGVNLLPNGGFESTLSGTWNLTANFAQSASSTAVKLSGNASLHVVATAAGSGSGNAIYQDIVPALTNGQPYSLSFWYLPTTSGGPLTVRLSGAVPGVTLDPAPPLGAGTPASPGATNSVFVSLPAFPALWLNEAHPDNVTGPLDNAAEREPWIELHNAGTTTLNLDGYFLSDSYTNLSRWAFPSNTSIPAGGFTLVWCDSQTNQSAVGAVHSNFRLASGAGKVALSRLISGTNQLVDYLTYTNLPSNWSYGNLPDAQPFYRIQMFQFTPGTTNSAASPPLNVFINEWLADNTLTLADPADNNYEDWLEIYNPGPDIADLGGYYLTDNLTNKFQFLVPANGHYLIPPGGFLLVWADNETGQNNTNRADLHAGFALSKGGDAIGVFAADGTRIDAVSFGAQTSDVSEGRFPQGSGGIFSMTPTPRAANVLPNASPLLAVINDVELTLGQTLVFTASATDPEVPPQVLEFSLGHGAPPTASIHRSSGQFQWTPATAPVTNAISVMVADNGSPSLADTQTFYVTVFLPPTITAGISQGQLQLSWPRGTLQEADEVTGPYSDVTDVSPFTPTIAGERKFYRIRL